MRLLLDEHFRPTVAEALRERGFDVVSALERGIAGTPDAELWGCAIDEGRVIVTYDRGDFLDLYQQFWLRGVEHPGLVIVLHSTIHQADPGGQIRALASLLSTHQDLANQVAFLSPASL